MSWMHPVLGTILAISRRWQPEKVWKHLFNAEERWETLAPVDPRPLHEEAVAKGCPPFRPSKDHPPFDWQVRRVLQRHHDAAYEPAYGVELASPETLWGAKRSDPSRWVARTPRAVVIFVTRVPDARVLTAYRPLPPLVNVGWGEEDFQIQADYVFEKETGMAPADSTRLAQDLHRLAGSETNTPKAVWWLALSVGRARARAAQEPELVAPLRAAEEVLRDLPVVVREGVGKALQPDDLLDQLADGLKGEHMEDAEAALSDLEDTLLVLATLGLDVMASDLLAAASSLLAWTPSEFAALARQAEFRQAELGGEGPAAALWASVDESLLGAQVRSVTSAQRPASRLVDSLVPAPTLLDRVAGWGSQGAEAVRVWTSAQLARVDVRPPVPVMGQPARVDEPWSVVGAVQAAAPWFRAFVVDAEYPEGHEVTSLVVEAGAALWLFEQPGQSATLVIVSAPAPVPGEALSDLLDAAEVRSDVAVLSRGLTRPR